MLKYNFCLFKRGSEILLLNREYPTWMGCWNGIGGKLEENESPRDSVLREIEEETQISSYDISFKGLVTWTVDNDKVGGMYIYLAVLDDDFEYPTPVKTDEGILDWKEVDWIMDPNNLGIAKNVPRFLEKVLYEDQCYDHHSIFQKGDIIKCHSTPIAPSIEQDELARKEYLGKYVRIPHYPGNE